MLKINYFHFKRAKKQPKQTELMKGFWLKAGLGNLQPPKDGSSSDQDKSSRATSRVPACCAQGVARRQRRAWYILCPISEQLSLEGPLLGWG